MSTTGICYLVGAGPGDPGLITVKGMACIRKADIIYYDHLASPALLGSAPLGAEMVYVGKKAGDHAVPQDQIGRLLCEAVRAGKVVTRLKGGDPFVFGRGGEEALDLQKEGLPFEVVPGVTAGIAGPAYAGIPVTHRNVATAVTFVTGHEMPGKPESQISWQGLATGSQTICFYMGVKNLPVICEKLVACGRPADDPVAVVRWGTTNEQRTVTGTLSTIAEVVEKAGITPPALAVVGPVVNLRQELQWFEKRPLLGKRILVTRSRTQASVLSEALRELGGVAVELPTIRIEPVAWDVADDLLQGLAGGTQLSPAQIAACDPLSASLLGLIASPKPDWLVFTSVNGVEHVFDRLALLGLDARVFGGLRVASIGGATSRALAGHGILADVEPGRFVAEELFAAIQEEVGGNFAGQRFLLLRADIARKDLPELLTEAGASVADVAAYRTLTVEACPQDVREDLLAGEMQAITFASSSTVRNLVKLLGGGMREILALEKPPVFASIGPVTSRTMRDLGLPIDVEAEVHTIPGLVEALQKRLAKSE